MEAADRKQLLAPIRCLKIILVKQRAAEWALVVA